MQVCKNIRPHIFVSLLFLPLCIFPYMHKNAQLPACPFPSTIEPVRPKFGWMVP